MAADFETVSTEDMIRYLHGVGVSLSCPRCGKDTWNLGTENDKDMTTYAYFRAKEPAGNVEMGEYWPVYLVGCSNCGFISHYSALKVIRWVRENPAKEEAAP